MLTVKKILAGRGAVDYYLNQTRRGLADYYLPEGHADERNGAARLSAPGSSWWGSGCGALELAGEVERTAFVPLFAKAVGPGRPRRVRDAGASTAAPPMPSSGISSTPGAPTRSPPMPGGGEAC